MDDKQIHWGIQVKKIFLFLLIFSFISLNAISLDKLFDAIKNAPESKINKIIQKELQITKEQLKLSLLPKISLMGSYEYFNNDSPLIALTPTKSAQLLKSKDSLPFGNNIKRIGLELSMPLFVKEIYDNQEKLKHLIKASKYKKKIDLLKREALLITLLSNFNHLSKLKNSLIQKKISINITLKNISIAIKNGRFPAFKKLKLEDALNQIDMGILDINSKISDIKSKIYSLTNISLKKTIKIVGNNYSINDYIFLKPIKEMIKADKKNLDAKKSIRYPELFIKAKTTKNYTNAYNTGKNIEENYNSIGIYMKWDIFDMKSLKDIKKAKYTLYKDKLKYQKEKKELIANEQKLSNDLKYFIQQISIAQKSLRLRKSLLKSAKVSFKLGTMSVNDYLQYENDLAISKAKLAEVIAKKNMTLANLALIYGNDLKKIFYEVKNDKNR